MRDLYSENYKILLKELKDTNKYEGTPCSWIGRLANIKILNISGLHCGVAG